MCVRVCGTEPESFKGLLLVSKGHLGSVLYHSFATLEASSHFKKMETLIVHFLQVTLGGVKNLRRVNYGCCTGITQC